MKSKPKNYYRNCAIGYILIALFLFFILRPILYALLFFFLTLFIYSRFRKKQNKKIVFLDSVLIHSFIVLPTISLVVWFFLPLLIEFAVKKSIKDPNSTFWINLIEFFSNFLLNLPTNILLILSSIIVLMLIFKIINIITAIKRKEYFWMVLMIITSPIEIIYYFLIGRKDMKG